MSTISSTQEAYEALCAGEFFQVGGQIINPDDIVRLDRSQDQPIFYLEDGTSVQGDKFGAGNVGDLLAEALTVATRGQNQRQQLPPQVLAVDTYTLQTVGGFGGVNGMIVPESGTLYTMEHNNYGSLNVKEYAIDGTDISTKGNALQSHGVSGVPIEDEEATTTEERKPGNCVFAPDLSKILYYNEKGAMQIDLTTAGDFSTMQTASNITTLPGLSDLGWNADLTWTGPRSGFAVDTGGVRRFETTADYDLSTFNSVESSNFVGSQNYICSAVDPTGTRYVLASDFGVSPSAVRFKASTVGGAIRPYEGKFDVSDTIFASAAFALENGERFYLWKQYPTASNTEIVQFTLK